MKRPVGRGPPKLQLIFVCYISTELFFAPDSFLDSLFRSLVAREVPVSHAPRTGRHRRRRRRRVDCTAGSGPYPAANARLRRSGVRPPVVCVTSPLIKSAIS